MKLVKPSIEYKKSFLDALEEYQSEEKTGIHFRNEHYNSLNINELNKDFQTYVNKEQAKEKGKGLPEGYVSESIYWLADNSEYVGRINIRHSLTENLIKLGGHIGYDIRPSKRGSGYGKKILKLALEKVRILGIEKILLTCSKNNIRSQRVIETNGGLLEKREGNRLFYWIAIK